MSQSSQQNPQSDATISYQYKSKRKIDNYPMQLTVPLLPHRSSSDRNFEDDWF